ncbi:hypothetical protein MRX96_026085 [Rhipicephalus microplus]
MLASTSCLQNGHFQAMQVFEWEMLLMAETFTKRAFKQWPYAIRLYTEQVIRQGMMGSMWISPTICTT